ncbi:chemotaxis protein CheV [Desulfuromonas acetoxidans]|uniref:Response regulator receiver modulated CheW protein n=1 Tax=Desulfuromonas acetoxidans (strain DSM 684 / 11070) TaxID=281689 RepID=Q1JWQ4_DESA6|nr:chemotaxis protein [Desulfuromonas acetoxidans]EAT14625.1 response regulator receiver modulated CheW protein [Desulfuromonas acetoxidans DSM 684]
MAEDKTLQEVMTRTSLSNSNQMEMLTFRLTDGQLYGINVFKIIEIVECPRRLDRLPYSNPAVRGVVDFRGNAITVIDLARSIGLQPVDFINTLGYLVVCEYNNQLNAFLVSSPEVLLTRSWGDIKKPNGFEAPSLVAIAYDDNQEMVLLLDIEGILSEIVGLADDFDTNLLEQERAFLRGKHVLLVDDSNAALMMMRNTLSQLGMEITEYHSAVRALEDISGRVMGDKLPDFNLIISDIEMPGMDGFTFTRSFRALEGFGGIPVILHSSMSNPTNEMKAHEAGATAFIPKFDPNVLVRQVYSCLSS